MSETPIPAEKELCIKCDMNIYWGLHTYVYGQPICIDCFNEQYKVPEVERLRQELEITRSNYHEVLGKLRQAEDANKFLQYTIEKRDEMLERVIKQKEELEIRSCLMKNIVEFVGNGGGGTPR